MAVRQNHTSKDAFFRGRSDFQILLSIRPLLEQISSTLLKICIFVKISIPLINNWLSCYHATVLLSCKIDIDGIHSKNEIEKWLNEGFKGNTLIFILFLYDGIQRNLGENLRYSRVLGVWKLENQWWHSLKLGDFGDVKGLRPLTSPKPPVSMNSSFQPPEHVKPQIFAQVSLNTVIQK